MAIRSAKLNFPDLKRSVRRRIGESILIARGYAYSPNVSNTGARSQYVAVGLGYELPSRLLPQNLRASFKAATSPFVNCVTD